MKSVNSMQIIINFDLLKYNSCETWKNFNFFLIEQNNIYTISYNSLISSQEKLFVHSLCTIINYSEML